MSIMLKVHYLNSFTLNSNSINAVFPRGDQTESVHQKEKEEM